jgi:hypothetical protein
MIRFIDGEGEYISQVSDADTLEEVIKLAAEKLAVKVNSQDLDLMRAMIVMLYTDFPFQFGKVNSDYDGCEEKIWTKEEYAVDMADHTWESSGLTEEDQEIARNHPEDGEIPSVDYFQRQYLAEKDWLDEELLIEDI